MNEICEMVYYFGIGMFLGFLLDDFKNSLRGRLVKCTNDLPRGYFRVISVDRISSVLEEINVDKKRFLVSSEVFGEKPIRPTDIVRKVKNDKERKDLGIKVLGYPPLVKEEIEL